MPDDRAHDDAEIIRDAYADRVREAFSAFAENLAVGQNEKSCRDRFVRSVGLARKARDLALDAIHGIGIVEPQIQAADATAAEIAAAAALSPEDQALVEHALVGTTGVAAKPIAAGKPPFRRF